MAMPANAQHAALAHSLSLKPASQNPFLSAGAMTAVQQNAPHLLPHLAAIAANPTLLAHATSGGSRGAGGSGGAAMGQPSATDPTGSSNPNRGVGYGQMLMGRQSNVRHNLLGWKATAVTTGGANQIVTSTPLLSFKPNRIVIAPTLIVAGNSIQQFQVGVRPQFAATTAEPFDVYGPTTYSGEVDFDVIPAAIAMSAYVNTTASATFYACSIGEVIGQPYRPYSSKLQVAGLGSTTVAAGASATIALSPLIDYTVRKIALTPGAAYSDAFIITSITCGVQNQLMSTDPIPASVFSDLYPLFLDLDKVSAAVPLTLIVQNITTASAVFQGTTRGDVDPSQLSRWGSMTSSAQG